MRRRTLLGAGCALLAMPRLSRAQAGSGEEVDLLLVLAADVSQSMQHRELELQRQGYVTALCDKQVLDAIGSGPCGAIAVAYLEWSGAEDQRVLAPWARLAGAEDAAAFARGLAEAPLRSGTWTSITGALAASRRLMAEAPCFAARQVVDISGDGENNHGGPVEDQRDQAVAEGITINGLPILRPNARLVGGRESGETALEEHYRRMVIGGAGAFVLRAEGFGSFASAIRRKLVLEIAGLPVPGRAAA
jgi:hypothetical protein